MSPDRFFSEDGGHHDHIDGATKEDVQAGKNLKRQKDMIMRKLSMKIIDKRYSKYEFNYIKPQRVKIPKYNDVSASKELNCTYKLKDGQVYVTQNATQIACGFNHSLILTDQKLVYGFGENSAG